MALPFGVERDDMDRVQMVNNRNILIASLLLLSLGTMPVYADGAGIEEKTPDQELLALCWTPEATPAMIGTLLKAGADIHARSKYGGTALIFAAGKNSNPVIIETLLKAGADVNARNEGGDTPLMRAARYNSNPAIIETLLEAGANAKAKDKEGKTAIDYAKKNKKIYKTKVYWKLNDALYE